jgi:hypothetical protein
MNGRQFLSWSTKFFPNIGLLPEKIGTLKGQSHEKVGEMRVFKVFILLNRTTSQLEGPCSSSDTNLFMLLSCYWTNSIGRSEQQPIETIQCERVAGPDAKVSDTPIPAL